MTKHEVTVGNYMYRMPHWDVSQPVVITQQGKNLLVHFFTGYYPTALKDIPEVAIFESTDAWLGVIQCPETK